MRLLFFIGLLWAISPTTNHCATTLTKLPAAIPATCSFEYEAAVLFQAITLPLQSVQDPFTLGIFEQIYTNFGPQGLNLADGQIALMQKAYLYLIFLAKLDLVQNNPQFTKYASDFSRFLTDNGTRLPHIPDQTLVTSPGWQAVTLTTDTLVASPFWQLFCKQAVADSQNFFTQALNNIHNFELQVFNYIPNIETSFYDFDYTNLRTANEVLRLRFVLETTSQNFYQQQCPDWKTLPSQINAPTGPNIESAITALQQTDYYTHTHNIYTLLGITSPESGVQNPTLTQAQLLNPQQLASPLKEQIWCTFLLKEVLSMLSGAITIQNLDQVLTAASGITPTFFPYAENEYVYLQELLALKAKSLGIQNESIHPSPGTYQFEDSLLAIAQAHAQKQAGIVKMQGFFSWISDAYHAVADSIVDAADALAKTGVDAFHGIEDGYLATYHAARGIVESCFGPIAVGLGSIFSTNLENWGTKIEKDALKNLVTATTDLNTDITDLTSALEEATVATADSAITALTLAAPALGTIIASDKTLGQDLQTTIAQVASGIAKITGDITRLTVDYTVDLSVTAVKFTAQVQTLIASAVEAMVTGSANPLEESAQNLVNGTISSITESFSNLLSDSETIIQDIMQTVVAITNAITTAFIDISKEASFTVALACNFVTHNPLDFEQELAESENFKDGIANVLNKHRAIINQVIGTAIVVVGSAAEIYTTFGTDTPEVIAQDAAIESELATSEEIGDETGAEIGGDTGGDDTGGGKETGKGDDDGSGKDNKPGTKPKPPKGKFAKVLILGMTALNAVFGITGLVSGINTDAQNILTEQKQMQQLENTWETINNNKLTVMQQQGACLKELEEQQLATTLNQMLSLQLFKDSIYKNINATEQSIAASLATVYQQLLTPNTSNKSLLANIGTPWGINTPYLNLFPSEGFFSVTMGRPAFPFAQEVAQCPYLNTDFNPTAKNPAPKNWYEQKIIALDSPDIKNPTDPLTVSINMQILYALDAPLYVGLYLGGKFYDYTSPTYLAQITAQKMIDIDTADLAKMVVLYKASANEPLQIGIYEQAGLGWILQEALPASMLTAPPPNTYNLSATLHEDELTVTLGINNDPSTIITIPTQVVTPLANQRTYGIISSGAAIQWGQTTPTIPLTNDSLIMTQAQAAATKDNIQWPSTNEITREQQAKIMLQKSFNPTFGNFTLTPLSLRDLILGRYVYTTTNTALNKLASQNGTDYVIFATNSSGSIISDIGIAPTAANNPNDLVLVSLVTGNTYDQKGNIISFVTNALGTYQTAFGPIDTTSATAITAAQAAINKALASITFGSFDLDSISPTALQNNQYIYSCEQTIFGPKPAIVDYLIFTQLDATNNPIVCGMPPNATNATALISLVTGNVYTKNTPIVSGKSPKPVVTGLYGYLSRINGLNTNDTTTITTAQKAWLDYLKQPKPKPKGSGTVIINGGGGGRPGHRIINHGSRIPPIHKPPKKSITSLQEDASKKLAYQIV